MGWVALAMEGVCSLVTFLSCWAGVTVQGKRSEQRVPVSPQRDLCLKRRLGFWNGQTPEPPQEGKGRGTSTPAQLGITNIPTETRRQLALGTLVTPSC